MTKSYYEENKQNIDGLVPREVRAEAIEHTDNEANEGTALISETDDIDTKSMKATRIMTT